jgi:L-xylulose reductase
LLLLNVFKNAQCPSIETVTPDLSDWTSTREVVGSLGPFDLLVNNAGVNKLTPFLEQTEEDLDR